MLRSSASLDLLLFSWCNPGACDAIFWGFLLDLAAELWPGAKRIGWKVSHKSHNPRVEDCCSGVDTCKKSAMDDFIDPFLSEHSWLDMNASAKSYGGEEKGPSICMIPSSMETIATEGLSLYGHDGSSSIFIDANLKYGISKGLFPGEKLSQHETPNHNSHPSQHDNKTYDGSFSLQGMIESHSTAGSFGPELNTSCPVALPHNSLTMSSSIESSGSEPSAFPASLGDSHSISSVPAMWPQSYSDVSFMGHGKLHGFSFQGVESDTDLMRKASLGNGKYPQLEDLRATALHDHNELHNPHLPTFSAGQPKLTSDLFQCHQQEQSELHNLHLPFFAAGSQMASSKTTGIQTRQQLSPPTQGNTIKHHASNSLGNQSQINPPNASACNGVVKPRVRARRGQATDPHSIAERLRREKIADRMKNLLELVPNSNKTDKASMLDEIIGYVKFLQLQVKVLSMSRLGAAGAVVPLITDGQAEGPGSLFLSSSVGQRAAEVLESQDNLAFEQEVVKLMESSITTAMQYLQNKGLCLMPIALASAISTQKGSAGAPPDRRKSDMNYGVISQSSPSLMGRNGGEDGPNGCNGGLVKQEEVRNLSAM